MSEHPNRMADMEPGWLERNRRAVGLDGDPCDNCQEQMAPEHAHAKCSTCGYIRPCCQP